MNPQPKMRQASSATSKDRGPIANSNSAKAITVQLSIQAVVADSLAIGWAVRITTVAPRPSAIHALTVTLCEYVPVSTRRLRPKVHTALEPAPISIAAAIAFLWSAIHARDRGRDCVLGGWLLRRRSTASTAAAKPAVRAPVTIQATLHSEATSSANTAAPTRPGPVPALTTDCALSTCRESTLRSTMVTSAGEAKPAPAELITAAVPNQATVSAAAIPHAPPQAVKAAATMRSWGERWPRPRPAAAAKQ